MSGSKAFERGDISFLFNPDLPDDQQSVVLNNKERTYTRLKENWTNAELEEHVDVLMVRAYNPLNFLL